MKESDQTANTNDKDSHVDCSLSVSNVSIEYSGRPAIEQVSLTLQAGQIGCLLGPSGCGKTTLLRAIAGFLSLDHGTITINGKTYSTVNNTQPPEKRQVGMVFQDFALFPHLTVERNVAFGIRSLPKDEQRQRVDALLSMIGLQDFAKRYPHELSGGQQQRVALVRALAPKPDLLLLDEPFSSIDVEFRERLAAEVRDLIKLEQTTALVVTHDQYEAFLMADQVGVMHAGRLEQWDTGYNLYHCPATRFVADFIGQGVFIDGRVLEDGRVETELALLEGVLPSGVRAGDRVNVLVRPDDIIHDDCSARTAIIKGRVFRGASYLYTLELPSGAEVLSLVHSHHDHAVGEDFGIRLEIAHSIVFRQE